MHLSDNPIERLEPPVDVSNIPGWGEGLTRGQYLFVCQYLVDLNSHAAGERLWCKGKRAGDVDAMRKARAIAGRMMKTYAVGRAIDQALAVDGGSARVQVIDELRAMAFFNPKDLLTEDADGDVKLRPLGELDDDLAKAVAGLTVHKKVIDKADGTTITDTVMKISLIDKQAALEKLGRAIGLFKRGDQPGADDAGGNVTVINVIRFADKAEPAVIEHRPHNGSGTG